MRNPETGSLAIFPLNEGVYYFLKRNQRYIFNQIHQRNRLSGVHKVCTLNFEFFSLLPPPLFELAVDLLYNKIQATSLILSAFPLPLSGLSPSDAYILYGCPLIPNVEASTQDACFIGP